MTFTRLSFVAAAGLSIALAAGAVDPGRVVAQDVQVNAGIKGTIGLGLAGAEIGFVLPAAFGLDDTWAFVVFPVIGGAGGAVAGWFLLDQGSPPGAGELSVIALAAGMALVIPAMVLTLSLTAYDPEDDDMADTSEEEPPDGGGGEGAHELPPVPADEQARARARRLAAAGTGLLRFSDRGVSLGVPGVGLAPTYSTEDVRRYGASQRSELHVPLLTGSF